MHERPAYLDGEPIASHASSHVHGLKLTSSGEVNDAAKRIVRDVDGRELDGAALTNTASSLKRPVIRLTELESETDRSIQQGYMQIMAGAMTGIRNPKAHGNLNPSANRALHLICLASLLMHKIDERISDSAGEQDVV